MPFAPPIIDDRRFQQLVDETLARVPVHTPEWTNFNQSDPGVTLVQLFAFLTENLLYRVNLIPERNRQKFLQLLRVPLKPAAAAQGLLTISNERGAAQSQALPGDLEVRAGAIPFRTQLGLDVLPIEARVFFKRRTNSSTEVLDYYRLLYASYQQEFPADPDLALYETIALDPKVIESVDLNKDAVDHSLWVALLARKQDFIATARDPLKPIRDELAGRTLTLGIVPALDAESAQSSPGGMAESTGLLVFELPRVADGGIARGADERPAPVYRQLVPRTDVDLLTMPGVVQLPLPAASELTTWTDLDPLEAGVGELPPALEDSSLADRVVTWLRISTRGAAQARIKWAGINTVPISQRERTVAEALADGHGTPDQVRRLAQAPVLTGSIEVVTRTGNGVAQHWTEIDDLYAAPPEVAVVDPRDPPGVVRPDSSNPAAANVFAADPEAGVLTFGDGLRGRRLPLGARVFASYEFCAGAAGNVGEGAINSAPALPGGFTVTNPVRSWGGADAETVEQGEKQIGRFLQHRDRLVSSEDFESIAWRTPGVQIGRIDVLPAFHPDLEPLEPGAAPGVVTVMAIPRFDAQQPEAPRANRLFLNALCKYLDPRRLITTELIVRGPQYKQLWISVGVDVSGGFAIAEVVENVKRALRAFLAPVGPAGYSGRASQLSAPRAPNALHGWPLRMPVASRVLLAESARVAGVTSVADVLLAEGTRAPVDVIEMTGLQLPWVVGISVVAGEPVPIEALRGGAAPVASEPTRLLLPVPVVPETC